MAKNAVVYSTLKAIEAFKTAFYSSLSGLLNACELYVQAIDKDKAAKPKFKEAMPKFSSAFWASIERVGRGQMHHLLLVDQSCASGTIKKLPISDQAKIIEEGVEVLADDGTALKAKHTSLTPRQTAQVFAKDHVRDLGEQKAYVETYKKIEQNQKAAANKGYTIAGGVVTFPAGFVATRVQIMRILEELVS